MIILSLLNKKRTRLSSTILALILLSFIWYQVEFFLAKNKIDLNLPAFFGTRHGSWLLIGPLFLLFVRSTVIKDFAFRKSQVLHFLPFILFTLLIPLLGPELTTKRSVDYGMLSMFDSWNSENITGWHYLYGTVFLVQFAHSAVYMLKSYSELRQFDTFSKNRLSSVDLQSFKATKYLLITGSAFICLGTLYLSYQFLTNNYRRATDHVYVLPMVAIVYGLLYRAIKYPDSIFYLRELPDAKTKYEKSSLSESAAKEYIDKLKTLVSSQRLYTNSELRLNDLSSELGISAHH